MGKSRGVKWYDKNNEEDLYETLHSADHFKQQHEKRLRRITDKHEELDERGDEE